MAKTPIPNKTMTKQKPRNPWLEAGPFRYVPGYINGRRQPCMLVTVKPTPQLISALNSDNQTPASFLKWWNEQLYAPTSETTQITDWPALANQLAAGTVQVLRYLGLPLLDDAQATPPATNPKTSTNQPTHQWTTITLPIPHCDGELILDTWQLMLQAISQELQTGKHPAQLMNQQLKKLKEDLYHNNRPLLLKASYELGLPVTPLRGLLTQFGYGRKSAWLEHTFTQQSANVSARIARDKQATAVRLGQAGIPVPRHHQVNTIEEAQKVAQALGYPVVVKPLDLDGGVGVAANLQNEQELRAAYAIAQEHSEKILVEKHINGRDYRLTVLDNEVIWAVERVPAGVTGDGKHNIEELVEKENATDARRPGPTQTLKPIVITSESCQLLQTQNLQLQSVPPEGQFVTLRRTANVANGGHPKVVTDQVHPDNRLLAIRAARALRLDLAGVDLIIPDISKSWRNSNNNGVICEVNAQPDLGSTTAAHLYPMLLEKRVKGDGRIPIIALIGAPDNQLATEVIASLQAKGYENIGWSLRQSAGINKQTHSTSASTFLKTMMLLTDPTVDALVFSIHDEELLKHGLPADKIDWLVLAGSNLQSKRPNPRLFQQLTGMMLPACQQVVILEEAKLKIAGLSQAAGGDTNVETLTTEQLLGTLRER